MALIVEDGTARVDAESYCTVAFADAYHEARGNTSWADLDDVDDKEPALRRATDYMIQVYRERWKGFRVAAAQALDWPRNGVALQDGPYGTIVQPNVVPIPVQQACAEYALRAVSASLAPDLTRGTLSETVGPISVTYDPTSPEVTRYRAVDDRLSIYLVSSGAMHQLVRS